MQSIYDPAGRKISREELKEEQRKTEEARKRRERLERLALGPSKSKAARKNN